MSQVSIKCKSKKELYEIFVADWGIYISPNQFANYGYVRGVITGEVKVRFELTFKLSTLSI